MKRPLRVGACVPAFNEEKTIARVVIAASKHVDTVVVIDDGSSDYTSLIAEKVGAYVIRHDQNRGKGVSLRDGFGWAKREKYDILVTLDADGQHDAEDIPKLLQPIVDGNADIVIGSRVRRPPSMPMTRRIGQKLVDSLAGVKSAGSVVDSQSGFRAYSRKAIEAIEFTEPGMGAELEILLKGASESLAIVEVPVVMRYGIGGTSKQNPIVQFSDVVSTLFREIVGRRPLRFLGIPGLLFVAYGVYGWLEILATYNLTLEFATGHALVYTIILLTGIFLTTSAIVLFVIRITIQEMRGR